MEARSLPADVSRQLTVKVSTRHTSLHPKIIWGSAGVGGRGDSGSRPPEHPKSAPIFSQVKEYKADLASLKEQLKAGTAGASDMDAARAELVRSRRLAGFHPSG